MRGLLGWLLNDSPTEEVSKDETAPKARVHGGSPKADLLQRFVDHGEIGRGGMSSVRRVVDSNLLREVAMKVLDPARAKSTEMVQEFLEEAQITGQLEHPNIVPVHELGVDAEGTTYFTMKLVRGHTLTKWVRSSERGRGTPEYLNELLHIFLKVCDAIGFAHSRGVIHRDLKPDNIMVGSFGEVYVVDWGLAKLVGPQARSAALAGKEDAVAVSLPHKTEEQPGRRHVVGTPAYMSPEQAEGWLDSIDERTDVFALGAVLYFILTGKHPYGGMAVDEALKRARACDFVPPEEAAADLVLPPAICRIARKAMERDPADRHPSVTALKDEVTTFLRGGKHLAAVTFTAGTAIVREGDPGDSAYIILRGRCVAFKTIAGQRRVLREMGPGSVFGETAVITGKPRTATVEAVEEVVATEVTRATLEAGLGLDTWLGAFVEALASRFREIDEKLTVLERSTSAI